MKKLIVGMDPGTTTGIAAIDLKGNIVVVESKKEFKASEIKEMIGEIGNPLFIATDKSKSPSTVKRFASSFNCVLFEPDHDLKVYEKKELIGMNEKILNVHEKDALASAVFAYKHYEPQFRKIERTLSALSLEKYTDKVKEMIVNKKAGNIAEAIEKIAKKDTIKVKIPKPAKKTDVGFLLKNLESQKKNFEMQRLYIDKLEKKVKQLEKEKSILSKKQSKKIDKVRKDIMKEKEISIRNNTIRQLRDELEKEKRKKKQDNNIEKEKNEKVMKESEKKGFLKWLKKYRERTI